MQYTITNKQTVDVKLTSETNIAISAFKKVLKAQKRLEKLEEELDGWVALIPDVDMVHYVAITDGMSDEFE